MIPLLVVVFGLICIVVGGALIGFYFYPRATSGSADPEPVHTTHTTPPPRTDVPSQTPPRQRPAHRPEQRPAVSQPNHGQPRTAPRRRGYENLPDPNRMASEPHPVPFPELEPVKTPMPVQMWQATADGTPRGAYQAALNGFLRVQLGADHPLQSVVDESFKRGLTRHLKGLKDAPDAHLLENWVESEGQALLDEFAMLLTRAVEAERNHGTDTQLSTAIERVFDEFDQVGNAQGWYRLQTIRPYRDAFDHRSHELLRDVESAAAKGQIVAIEQVGIEWSTGHLRKARVVRSKG